VPASTSEGISRRELIGASAALGALGLSGTAAEAANELDVSRLVRTAIFVSNLERSLAFYRDLLGLDQTFFQGEFGGPVLGRLLGIPATTKVRAHILKAEGPAFGMIGLFEVGGPRRPRVRKRRGTVNIGESVLVFYMPRLDPLVERLRAGGYDIVSPPVNLVPRFREMMFYGPDDQLINVIEQEHRSL
jgi:catechol 2,3-dioxygenase-like lactoylglutathione lyase family enzyme